MGGTDFGARMIRAFEAGRRERMAEQEQQRRQEEHEQNLKLRGIELKRDKVKFDMVKRGFQIKEALNRPPETMQFPNLGMSQGGPMGQSTGSPQDILPQGVEGPAPQRTVAPNFASILQQLEPRALQTPGAPIQGVQDEEGGQLAAPYVEGRNLRDVLMQQLEQKRAELEVNPTLIGARENRAAAEARLGKTQEFTAGQNALARTQATTLAETRETNANQRADAANQTRLASAGISASASRENAATRVAQRPLTEGERRAYNFYLRADDAVKTLQAIEPDIVKLGLTGQARLKYAPNIAQSQVGQTYDQAQRQFTEARLRKDSGAAIPPQEYENDKRTYFAQPGDTKATLERKRLARDVIIRALKFEAKRAIQQDEGAMPTPPPSSGGAPRPRAVNPQTGAAVEWDGKAWVPAQQ